MIDVHIDVAASVAAMPLQGCVLHGVPAMKGLEDLKRHEWVIRETVPDLVIQTGTAVGGSAMWLAHNWFFYDGPDVITIDVDADLVDERLHASDKITVLNGSSTDEEIVSTVKNIAWDYDRVQVILDSDHSSKHVSREIELYAPLVSSGCYLVIEDGIYDFAGEGPFNPGPLTAIVDHMPGNPLWTRDLDLERLFPVSMYPAGWWKRK